MKIKKVLSIHSILIMVFILSTLLTASVIGYLIFSNWIVSAQMTTKRLADDMNQNIAHRLDLFMSLPEQINEANQKLISNGILDLSDREEREKFFVGVLSAQSAEIYSVSYGAVSGEYFGARRNEHGVVELIMSSAETGGNSRYYSVTEDLTAGEQVFSAGPFDPRTRVWYQAAAKAGGPVFSPVYQHFVMDDLTVSAACPIYNKSGSLQGVLGTHILLSKISAYLETIVQSSGGYAFIVEKDSGELIANSLGIDNVRVQDGKLSRLRPSELNYSTMQQIYEQYKSNEDAQAYSAAHERLFIHVEEYQKEGVDWLVFSAVPKNIFIGDILRSIHAVSVFALVTACLLVLVYCFVVHKLLKLMKARTEELEENKEQLHLILDSTAEAIYGIDMEGNCTFCNLSCIRLLGYETQEELLGKNMHRQVHHSRRDRTPLPMEECRIIRAIRSGAGVCVDDEVFWKADGSCFFVEYNAYPQIKNGKLIGAVITFTDITDRKRREEKIQYLSNHDPLTGLYNRHLFEEKRIKIDLAENLPLSVVFADINGLKMTNDIFGHAAGDALIKKSSEILSHSCREQDVVARVGGDEFIMLLPRTSRETAEKILLRIRSGLSTARVAAIKCSIALGSDTKTSAEQSLDEIIANAEDNMYKDKTLNRKAVNKDIIDTIIETLHTKNPKEKRHSMVVSELCGAIGAALHLPEPTVNKLKREGYLHDIGKIVLTEGIISKDTLTEEELERMEQHSVVGYRILNLFDDTLDLAEDVYGHHERWDGNGYPRGLKGEQIPLLSRIIAIAERYERIVSAGERSYAERKKKALEAIQEGAGIQFDPHIARLFVQMMEQSED